jgi:hypothetical protein
VTRKEKLEAKIRNNPRNISLEDFEALIKQYGHIEEGGRHPKAIFGNEMFPYKRENPIKPAYVNGILELIDNLK